MVKHYNDHAANERSFLAWVRTSIAVMAFGFVIEPFDLFLRYAAPPVAQQQIAPHTAGPFLGWTIRSRRKAGCVGYGCARAMREIDTERAWL